MKRNLFSGLTALVLAIGFVLVGCGDDPPPTSAEQAAALAATLGGLGKATVHGAVVTLISDVTIAGGTTVTVPGGVTLVVPSDETLTVTGKLTVTGTLNVDPSAMLKLDATSVLNIAGTLNITSESTVSSPNFEIVSGASITLAATAFVDTTGWNVSGTGALSFYTTTLAGADAGAQLKVRESTLQGLATGSSQAAWRPCPQDANSTENTHWNAGLPIVIQKGDGGAYSNGVSILTTSSSTASGWYAKHLEWQSVT
jgi:hypothetical protein